MKKSVLFAGAAALMMCFASCNGGKSTSYWIFRQLICQLSRKTMMAGLPCLTARH